MKQRNLLVPVFLAAALGCSATDLSPREEGSTGRFWVFNGDRVLLGWVPSDGPDLDRLTVALYARRAQQVQAQAGHSNASPIQGKRRQGVITLTTLAPSAIAG